MIELQRLVLGPRDKGRGYGVIASSPDLTLTDEALAAVQDFNLRIGDYVASGVPISACFPISSATGRALWFACTTTVHGRAGGNTVWVTWGALIDRTAMTALEGRAYRLFGLLERERRPKLGEDLPALSVDPEALSAASGEAPPLAAFASYAAQAGRKRLTISAHAPARCEAVLDRIMDCLTPDRREELSVVDAPVGVRRWDLIVYQEELWESNAVSATGTAQVIRAGAADLSGGEDPSVLDLLWNELARTVAQRPDLGGSDFARELNGCRRLDHSGLDEAASLELRFATLLREALAREREDEARLRVARLAAAVASLPPALRRPPSQALLRVWQLMFDAVADRSSWYDTVHRLGADHRSALGVPELLLPRIAIEAGVVFSLTPEEALPMAEPLTTVFRTPLIRHAIDAPAGRADTAACLLEFVLPRLAAHDPDTQEDWRLVNQLGRRVAENRDTSAATLTRCRKVLVELLETSVTMRRSDGIEIMFQPTTRAKVRDLFEGEYEQLALRIRDAAAVALTQPSAWKFAFAVDRRVRL